MFRTTPKKHPSNKDLTYYSDLDNELKDCIVMLETCEPEFFWNVKLSILLGIATIILVTLLLSKKANIKDAFWEGIGNGIMGSIALLLYAPTLMYSHKNFHDKNLGDVLSTYDMKKLRIVAKKAGIKVYNNTTIHNALELLKKKLTNAGLYAFKDMADKDSQSYAYFLKHCGGKDIIPIIENYAREPLPESSVIARSKK